MIPRGANYFNYKLLTILNKILDKDFLPEVILLSYKINK